MLVLVPVVAEDVVYIGGMLVRFVQVGLITCNPFLLPDV